jgi:hypothetical protein
MNLFFVFTIVFSVTVLASEPGYTLKSCEQPETRLTAYEGAADICFPDTLYHWTNKESLNWKTANTSDKSVLPFPQKRGTNKGMYFSRTPVSSHGYGDVSIRVKLKKNVRFELVSDARCFKLEKSYDITNTVFYRGYKWPFHTENIKEGGYLSEFIICDSEVVHSWSYGTQTHFNEMQDEAEWVNTHDVAEVTGFMTGVIPWNTPGMDGASFRYPRFLPKLQMYEENLKHSSGKIFCSEGKDCSEEHFETKLPIYYINH